MSDETPTARHYLVGVAAELLKRAAVSDQHTSHLVAKAEVATALAELPAELSLRAWLGHNPFMGRA